jgi:photosystem II stability/assembly factor-like uncharacterized protein
MGGIRCILLAAFAFLLIANTASAQWEIEDSHTTASLRGIHNVGGGVAWASGTGGTVLRTLDDGKTWQTCPIPLAGTKDTAEKLDFRGIQAFDEKTAIVMSSGPGDQSRLYKTTDGCQTWKLLFINPDKNGFWDALIMSDMQNGWLLGDPIGGKFVVGQTSDGGTTISGLTPPAKIEISGTPWQIDAGARGAFAASNSAFAIRPLTQPQNPCQYMMAWFGTGGPDGALIIRLQRDSPQCSDTGHETWIGTKAPLAGDNSTSGVFSLAFRNDENGIAVGGDYSKPNEAGGTEAFSIDDGKTWLPAQTPPHGYRSAVAYDPNKKTWITVGPNGTDISTDDGRNWRPLTPTPHDAPDADKNWNALSLPFVVGPKGRIGKLRATALGSVRMVKPGAR